MINKIKRLHLAGTPQKVILMFFSCFFQHLCEFVKHCNKIHIFLCLVFFSLFDITGRNEAIIHCRINTLFFSSGIFLFFSGDSHH